MNNIYKLLMANKLLEEIIQRMNLYATKVLFVRVWKEPTFERKVRLTCPFEIFLTTIDLDVNCMSYTIGKISPVKSTELNGISKQLEWEIQSSTELVPRD